ncbi:cardiolipin synthase [Oceanispirochaeta crateris]|uniref:Cardiolipin synthase n=1 Tax=Oceanispirochaeta crateris TaxID=2518645 RepID=A0A5C1QIJ1_9SPIO|nr:cardiolipin synthase [Oceanispirochaeta crateris]QEN07401.1 cardiolipin synthase [Oceanispirochaeta crateris]
MLDYLYYANFLVTLGAVIIILLSNKESESTIAWLLIIMVLPVWGLLFYILFGIDVKKYKVIQQRPEELFAEKLRPLLQSQKELIRDSEIGDSESLSDVLKSMNLLLNANQAALTIDNSVNLFYTGEELFKNLINELEHAKESIHMEYFIWKSDELGKKIKDILVRKAQEGVSVKLIFDGLGSFGRISFQYKKDLRNAGVEFSYFKDLNRFIARLKINYSNHKKIVIIDSRIAYTGGMNIGSEYIDGGKRFDSWRDTHIRLQGNSVRILQTIFLTDWFNCGHEMLVHDDFFPEQQEKKKGIPLQIAVSGPDSQWNSIELLIFNIITNANHEVYIQSPYFIPDLAIMRALESAALSGIKIKLMMAGIPDKKIAWWTAYTYFEPLLRAGVRILHYKGGFLHSKVVIMDNIVSTIGTCNMDIRSFRLNYEVNAVFYDQKINMELKDHFMEDEKKCREITLDEMQTMKISRKLRNSVCRLFSPLM